MQIKSSIKNFPKNDFVFPRKNQTRQWSYQSAVATTAAATHGTVACDRHYGRFLACSSLLTATTMAHKQHLLPLPHSLKTVSMRMNPLPLKYLHPATSSYRCAHHKKGKMKLYEREGISAFPGHLVVAVPLNAVQTWDQSS